MGVFDDFIDDPSEDRGNADRRMLRALLDAGHPDPDFGSHALNPNEYDSFTDMLDRLEHGQRELTAKQREWAERRCDELGVDWEDPAERNKNVPRGREVEPMAVLRDCMRPLKPPGRKA